MAILLRTGTKQLPVSALSQQILKQINRLSDLEHLSLQELQQINGIGVVKSIEIKAMIELSKRIFKDVCLDNERILSSEKLAQKMMLELGAQKQEHLVAIYLDTQNHIIEQRTIFIGTVRRSVA